MLGFAIPGIVQAWVPGDRTQRSLSGRDPKPVAIAAGRRRGHLGSAQVGHKPFLNVPGLAIFTTLMWLTRSAKRV